MTRDSKPVLAITMGDPAGTGPEIIAKAVSSNALRDIANVVCVGHAKLMENAFAVVQQPYVVRPIDQVEQAKFEPDILNVLHLENIDLDKLQPGKVQASAGHAAYEYITRAIELALEDNVAGVVTSAINKEALQLAGHKYDGHTEIFATQTRSKTVAMMLASKDFRVVHVSTHCSLRQAIERVKPERILNVIRLTNDSLKQMGIAAPKLAVAGLNPHSGEGGLFGREEIEQIQPAIDLARAEGMNVSDRPEPPDTVFVRMLHFKEFDAVIAQYHDQGHIAAKIVDFWGGVNITLGLPIIRTSVDHGTAFDIVGTGKARIDSLVNAVKYAQVLAENRPSM
jgi:4-hydroxythreonine-4-phosphate dehydrogenase